MDDGMWCACSAPDMTGKGTRRDFKYISHDELIALVVFE